MKTGFRPNSIYSKQLVMNCYVNPFVLPMESFSFRVTLSFFQRKSMQRNGVGRERKLKMLNRGLGRFRVFDSYFVEF